MNGADDAACAAATNAGDTEIERAEENISAAGVEPAAAPLEAATEGPCAICLDDELTDGVLLPCPGRHGFCRECLVTVRRLECPVCRDASENVSTLLFSLTKPEHDVFEWMVAQMVSAAEVGAVGILRQLLAWDCKIDCVDPEGWTPLMHAASAGQEAVVQFLLESGATRDSLMPEGETPLMLAADGGHAAVVRLLLEKGADVHAAVEGETSLHAACAGGHVEVARGLLSARADANARTDDGYSALNLAASENRLDVCRLLLDANADTESATLVGETALILAGELGVLDIVRLLVESSSNVNASTKIGYSVLHVAASAGHVEVLRYLIESNADKEAMTLSGRTAMHLAASDGHADIVRYLAELRADCNASDTNGRHTPLHLAAFFGLSEVCQALLQARANVNATMTGGQSALHLAVGNGYTNTEGVVRQLCDGRADLELRTCKYKFLEALTFFANTEQFELGERVCVVSKITAQDGQVLQPGRKGTVVMVPGTTPGDVAQVEADSVPGEERLRFCAVPGQIAQEVDPRELRSREPFQVGQRVIVVSSIYFVRGSCLLPGDRGTVVAMPRANLGGLVEVEADAVRGQEALRFPANIGQIAMAEELTPLQIAAGGGPPEALDILIDAGARLDVGPRTPLHLAAERDRADTVRSLLGRRADATKRTESGWTALCVAAAGGHCEVTSLLVQHESLANVTEPAAPVHTSALGIAMAKALGAENLSSAGCGSSSASAEPVQREPPDEGSATLEALRSSFDMLLKDSGIMPEPVRPLHLASFFGHVDVVRILLEANHAVNAKSKVGQTALHMAVCGEEGRVIQFEDCALHAVARSASVVQCLLDAQADPEVEVSRYEHLVSIASLEREEHFELGQRVRVLSPIACQGGFVLQPGHRCTVTASPGLQRGEVAQVEGDATPVQKAFRFGVHLGQITSTLVPLGLASREPPLNGERIRLLTSTYFMESQESLLPGDRGRIIGHVEGPVDSDFYSHWCGGSSSSSSSPPLSPMPGRPGGACGAFTQMLQVQADPVRGQMAFRFAAFHTQITMDVTMTPLQLASAWGAAAVVQQLTRHGARVNRGPRAALLQAAELGHVAVLRVLVAAAADPEAQTQTGWTALSLAAANGHAEAAELLAARRYGAGENAGSDASTTTTTSRARSSPAGRRRAVAARVVLLTSALTGRYCRQAAKRGADWRGPHPAPRSPLARFWNFCASRPSPQQPGEPCSSCSWPTTERKLLDRPALGSSFAHLRL
eukprot:TRINITY_DN11594_c0_g1_i4.p1 TRINITY_DN11594_c0_g1~~TRINITY_DN11594_c0_g1_i4.p1  ORF type:complete len:1245 (-),score=220.14 TRINITY_DN11594_c0_g1_i4:2-3736(-)